MFEAKILSGCWDEQTIKLTGMPKDFVLSARPLVVLEIEEFSKLQAENKQLKKKNKIYDWAVRQFVCTLKRAQSYLHGQDEHMNSEINETIEEVEQALKQE